MPPPLDESVPNPDARDTTGLRDGHRYSVNTKNRNFDNLGRAEGGAGNCEAKLPGV